MAPKKSDTSRQSEASREGEIRPELSVEQHPSNLKQTLAWIGIVLVTLLIPIVVVVLFIKLRPKEKPFVPLLPIVVFGDGFTNEETGKDGSWRWMAEQGDIHLRNDRKDMILKLNARAPVDTLPKAPTIKIYLNDVLLDEFLGHNKRLDHVYQIKAAQLGDLDQANLRITTTQIVIPSNIDPSLSDNRHLGFQIYRLEWTPRIDASK